MLNKYSLFRPSKIKYPIIISCPHAGREIPDELREEFVSEQINPAQDTDWYLEKLYNFASSIGVVFIHSLTSRYIVDLNRSSQDETLYNDGRQESTLLPLKSFAGKNLYKTRTGFDLQEKNSRLQQYYWPYHHKLEELINEIHSEFGQCLVFEGHSIKRNVPLLYAKALPDFILGNKKGETCPMSFLENAKSTLDKNLPKVEVCFNDPFMGGHITRHYANKSRNVFTMQLEMCQDLYMKSSQYEMDPHKFDIISNTLKKVIINLGEKLLENH